MAETEQEKTENKLAEFKSMNEQAESSKVSASDLQRKVDLLENELDTAEKTIKDLNDK